MVNATRKVYNVLTYLQKNYQEELAATDFDYILKDMFKGKTALEFVKGDYIYQDDLLTAFFVLVLYPKTPSLHTLIKLCNFIEKVDLYELRLNVIVFKDILKRDSIALPMSEWVIKHLFFNPVAGESFTVYFNIDSNLKKPFTDWLRNAYSKSYNDRLLINYIFPDNYEFEDTVDFTKMPYSGSTLNGNVKMSFKGKVEDGDLYLPFDVICVPKQQPLISKILEVRG